MAIGAHELIREKIAAMYEEELSLDFVEELLAEDEPLKSNEVRTCKTCGETKPLTDFYQWRPIKPSRSWDCRVCFSAKVQARKKGVYTPRTEPFPREIEAAEGSKICKTCGVRKELDKFYYDTRYKHHVTKCIACTRIDRSKAFAEKNKDKKQRRSERFASLAESEQRGLLQQRRYNSQRKLRRNGINAKYKGDGLGAVLLRDGQICYLCGKFVELADLEFDHIVPLSRGGSDALVNIAVSHRWCNRQKHNKLPEEYLRNT
jgi:5-methylcytosine-specific restriction endonuclease McrA